MFVTLNESQRTFVVLALELQHKKDEKLIEDLGEAGLDSTAPQTQRGEIEVLLERIREEESTEVDLELTTELRLALQAALQTYRSEIEKLGVKGAKLGLPLGEASIRADDVRELVDQLRGEPSLFAGAGK